jgi:hypothetical protein
VITLNEKMPGTTLMLNRIIFAVAASYQDIAAGPDNRPRKEPGLRRVPFVKTAPIINFPV